METGKLPADHLVRLLERYTGAVRPDVLMAGRLGEDASYLRVGDTTLVLATDPVTAAESDLGTIAFNINMNDIATTGARGVGILVTVLLPPHAEPMVLDEIMAQLDGLCRHHGLAILGGHTEVTDSVNRPVVSVTAVGTVASGQEIYSSGLKAGDSLIVSKTLGIEGTLILADVRRVVARAVLSPQELDRIAGFRDQLSVIPEGRIGAEVGVHSMHDITEGGILGGVYEIVRSSGLGCVLNRQALPFDEATLKLVRALDLDELKLISSGAMLFGTDRPAELIEALEAQGIPAAVVGEVTAEPELWLLDEDTLIPLEAVSRDEIYRIFER